MVRLLRVALGVVALSLGYSLVGCGSSPSPALGEAGESCTARRDCAAGLQCIEQTCVDPANPDTSRLGGVGESCRARNDCAVGLACVADVCVNGTVSIKPSAKSCYKVECTTKADCCADFQPSPSCAEYKQQCDADPAYCLTYRTFCQCNKDCQNQLCVDTPPSCKSNAECTSLATPFCVEGACHECAQPSDCPVDTDRCVHGNCVAPCTADAQCPLFSECQNGTCVDVGCKTDRECVFFMKDTRATCDSGKCSVPCVYSEDCPDFEMCDGGKCVFVGCNTDAECRAYFGLQNETGNIKAVCK